VLIAPATAGTPPESVTTPFISIEARHVPILKRGTSLTTPSTARSAFRKSQ
jgi:hypothetical protein